MRYVEQYVKARYPEYLGGSPRSEDNSVTANLPSLKEEQEFVDDPGSSKPLHLEEVKKRVNFSGSGYPSRDLSGCFGNSHSGLKKIQLEPSRLLDIFSRKSTSLDSFISIPEIHARNRVLKHCGVNEEDYLVVFTTGMREAMMLVGESYPFFRYNYYMSVLNDDMDLIKEFASYKDAKVISAPESWLDLRIAGSQLSQHFRKKGKHSPKGLFAYPVDIRGTRTSLHWVSEGQRNCWHVLLDASGLVLCEDQLNLILHKPDYVICTLSKVVGHPTSVTCLLVRRSSFESSQL
ncbi:hypothetical protein O6H91_23G051900 [Diphasiastrum complanatum]|nr:hypothetical protein O6H91_23G050900 [Diphasiastrum complanatum]KAJ7514605.1 hypothetical protein O6H91_23G051900 [Diphasiastrum complanatum]